MKLFTSGFFCTCWLLFQPLVGFAQATFSFNIQQPITNSIVGNELFVQVAVTSTYELQTVSASVGGVNAALAFSAAVSGWTNTLSLSGIPRGLKTLTITAVDAFGNSGQAQTTVLKDLPPTLTVADPRIDTVANPYLEMNAVATDDDPIGTVINVYAGTNLLAIATNNLSTRTRLSGSDGQALDLRFDAVDSVGHTNSVWRRVYVLTGTNWVELAQVEGPILDVSTNAILFVDGNILTTKSRLSGNETVLLDDTSIIPTVGALTSQGALFGTAGDNTSFPTVYELRSRTLTNLGPGTDIGVQGNWAVWLAGPYAWNTLTYRDLSAATNTAISGLAYAASLAPNGDVVYITGPSTLFPFTIVSRFRNGTSSQVADGSYYYTYGYVGTDGTNIVYEKAQYPASMDTFRFAAMSDGVTETILATNKSVPTVPVISEGWIAFPSPSSSGVVQIWTRSPAGVQTQRTFFGTSSKTQALAPNGELVFANGGHLYLVRDTPLPLDLGAWNFAAAGKVFWQQGRWYAQLGRSLFVVSTPPAISAANWAAGGQFRLVLNGNVGDTVVTQCSTNLVNWSNIATNTVTNGVFEVFGPVSPGVDRMFYRAFTPVY